MILELGTGKCFNKMYSYLNIEDIDKKYWESKCSHGKINFIILDLCMG